jgi:hypothetical protein
MLRKMILALGLVLVATAPSYALETRCGWLDNPTPANWWLTDRDSRWTISVQGGYHAKGMDNISEIAPQDYVKTNGYYGYSCACLKVTTHKKLSRIQEIRSFKSLPLQQCRQDPALPVR